MVDGMIVTVLYWIFLALGMVTLIAGAVWLLLVPLALADWIVRLVRHGYRHRRDRQSAQQARLAAYRDRQAAADSHRGRTRPS